MSFSVFVGGIPCGATEEQLKEYFSKVGPVHSFRLMVDRETAKPKGFGFCEYTSAEAAASAIRNLNNAEFHGRPLRVDSTSEDGDSARREQARSTQPGVDMIKKLVLSLSRAEMVDILAESQKFMIAHPESAKQLLTENPAVSQTLLQILVIFELVKKEDIAQFAPSEVPRPPPSVDRWGTQSQPSQDPYMMRMGPRDPYAPPPPPPRGVPPPPPRGELDLPPLGHLNPYDSRASSSSSSLSSSSLSSLPPQQPPPYPPPSFPPPMPRPGMRDMHPGMMPRMDSGREREGYSRDREAQPPLRELQPMPLPPREPPPPTPSANPPKQLSEEHKKLLQQIPNLKPEDIAKLPEKVQQQVLLLKKILAQKSQ